MPQIKPQTTGLPWDLEADQLRCTRKARPYKYITKSPNATATAGRPAKAFCLSEDECTPMAYGDRGPKVHAEAAAEEGFVVNLAIRAAV